MKLAMLAIAALFIGANDSSARPNEIEVEVTQLCEEFDEGTDRWLSVGITIPDGGGDPEIVTLLNNENVQPARVTFQATHSVQKVKSEQPQPKYQLYYGPNAILRISESDQRGRLEVFRSKALVATELQCSGPGVLKYQKFKK